MRDADLSVRNGSNTLRSSSTYLVRNLNGGFHKQVELSTAGGM